MNQKGFTILEVILALAILGTIGIVTINILSQQLSMRQRISEINRDQHTVDAALNRIVSDVEGSYLSDPKNFNSLNLYNRSVIPQFYFKKDSFVFFTMAFHSIINGSNQSNQAMVRYFARSDPNDANRQQLVRVVDTDFVNNIEDADVGLSEVLLDDLEKFTVEFWNGNEFVTDWDSRSNETINKLPKMVKVHLSQYSTENGKVNSSHSIDSDKRKTFSLDTIVYLNNAEQQSEVATPNWTDYKWQ